MKPDIVIIDEQSNLDIWELTVPFESNIPARHVLKENKYAFMITDIKTHKTSVTAYEVGSRGYITKENYERLKTFHGKYCKKNIKLKTFINNISAITINTSYLIYICRKEPVWPSIGYFKPPF